METAGGAKAELQKGIDTLANSVESTDKLRKESQKYVSTAQQLADK